MAPKRKPPRKRKIAACNTGIAVFLCVVALLSAFFTFAPYMNLPFDVPGWRTIFAYAGLREDSEAAQAPCSVHFIDVGQGDCILVLADGKAALIDAGEKENAELVRAYLDRMDVKQLDYVVATHPHADHIGALADLLNRFPTKQIIMPRLDSSHTPTTKTYENLLKAVKQSGAQVIPAKPGAQYTLGDAAMTILSPYRQTDELNNMSVVIRLTYGNISYLLTGDAERSLEEDILSHNYQVRADVLKLGHHGSSTSTTDQLLDAVNPEVAIISCGKDNDYGHPSGETLERLQKRRISYYRTDERGSIVIGTDGTQLFSAFQKESKEAA